VLIGIDGHAVDAPVPVGDRLAEPGRAQAIAS
jgi:hypothetical protein